MGRGPRLIIVGGEVRERSRAIVGPLTRRILEDIHVDRALMGTFAMAPEDGLTTTDPGEAYTKELVLGRAREVILLADSGKFGTHSLVRAGTFDDIDILVTDARIDQATERTLTRRGIKVIKA